MVIVVVVVMVKVDVVVLKDKVYMVLVILSLNKFQNKIILLLDKLLSDIPTYEPTVFCRR